MKFFNRLSLREKMITIIVSTVLLILTIGFAIGIYSQINSIRENFLAEKILTAKIVSSYTVADLTFNSRESALESLSYLKRDKSVLNAHLYNAQNQNFVNLYDHAHTHTHLDVQETWYEFEDNELNIIEPIFLDNKKIGSLYLHASTAASIEQINTQILSFALLVITLALIAFFLARKLAKVVTMPILSLASAARKVTQEKTYQLDIPVKYHDETGQLIKAFNEMLLQLNHREKERDLAELQLKESKQNLQLILDNMVNAIITITETGEILTINKVTEKLFHFNADELIGENIRRLIPLDTSANNSHNWQNLLMASENQNISFSLETQAFRKDDDTLTIRLSINEVPHNTFGKHCFICTCQDLTQLKHQEEQMRRTQKMDALGKLTGGIAHDYNNMLGVVTGYSELLENSLIDQPQLAKYARQIHHAGERGAKLTQKLLAFSRKSTSEELDVVNINSLLFEEQHMLEKTLTVRIKLIMDLQKDGLWPVYLDKGELEDAILNISINAMHAIESNGQLTLQTRNVHYSPIDAHRLDLSAGDYVSLSITDTGCGMDQETIDKIFDPFYSTKGDKGTGLGLSQVYGFVERSGGNIKVYSEVGKGTRFTIYFPRYYSDTEASQTNNEVDVATLSGNETILIVDDEATLLNLSDEILSQHGYRTLCAQNAAEALMLLERETVDLMISDVIMPEMDGYQLAAIVREHYPDIKIQLASGFSDGRHANHSDDELHRNLLHKPFNSQTLLQRIKKVLDQKKS